MTSASHPSAAMFLCQNGNNCEFFKHYDECKKSHSHAKPEACQQKIELSRASKLNMYIAQKGVWAGIGAATNCLSGGDPIAGALFNPLTSIMNQGLNFIVSKSPFTIKNEMTLTHIVKALTIKGVSMFAVASTLNTLGYPVTNTTLTVNLIPRITIIALTLSLGVVDKMLDAGEEGMAHMHYHKIPCPCSDINPEIEQAEKFLKEHQNQIPQEANVLLQTKIEAVKQSIASGKDIKTTKEQLVLEIEHAKMNVLTVLEENQS